MSEAVDRQEPRTYYANIVTSNLTVDELTMEFRRIVLPYKSWAATAATVVKVPPPSVDEIMATEPIARVVLTFTAAKALKQYLDQVIPTLDEARRAGREI